MIARRGTLLLLGALGLVAVTVATIAVRMRRGPDAAEESRPRAAAQSAPAGAVREGHAQPGGAPADAGRPQPDPAAALEEAGRRTLLELMEGLGVDAGTGTEPLPVLVDRALDPAETRARRIRALRRLARSDEEQAFAALERLLYAEGDPVLRREAAAALGVSPHPEAPRLLEALLDDGEVAAGAVEALALRGDTDALRALVRDGRRPAWIRAEAARALGQVGDDAETAVLVRAFVGAEDEELAEGLLEGLAAQDAPEAADVFRALLADPRLDADRKLAALDALAEGSPQAGALLVETAASAPDETVRAAAAESLAWVEEAEAVTAPLGELLGREESPAVRAALYQTLGAHAGATRPQVDALVPRMLAEESPAARRQAYRLAAILLHHDPDPRLAAVFDEEMVAWLRRDAEEAESPQGRATSLSALGLAGTGASEEALRDLTHSSDDRIAAAARRALDRRRRAAGR
ncbi:MAG: HEAT repeat domain-containing protein [Myxococcota bacterium]|nr:HEAT repeat domain-containing protein [Myxococcota bacterium]